jgi:hypothetical protein
MPSNGWTISEYWIWKFQGSGRGLIWDIGPEFTRRKWGKPLKWSIKLVCVPGEIRTGPLSNTNQKHYRFWPIFLVPARCLAAISTELSRASYVLQFTSMTMLPLVFEIIFSEYDLRFSQQSPKPACCHLLSRWFLARTILRLPKRRMTLNGLHGVISQKIETFILSEFLQHDYFISFFVNI